MLRRPLLLLDGIAPDAAVGASAAWLTRRHGVELTVALSLDRDAVLAPEATVVGGLASAEHRNAKLLERLEHLRHEARARIERQLEEAGVTAAVLAVDGGRDEALPPLTHAHDLTIASHALRGEGDSEAIDRAYALDPRSLLGVTARPLLLVDAMPLADGPALVADDGGVVAARALASALHLGLLEGRDVHLIAVADDPDEAGRLLTPARELCAAHGLAVEAHAETGDPGSRISAKLEALGAALVVMGAYGQRSIKTWLFGSTTTELLDRCAPPMFIQA